MANIRVISWVCNRLGISLVNRGRSLAAARWYRRAIHWDASWDAPLFNLGLELKAVAQWRECLEANQQAVRLNPCNEGAWWNLGIAATALSHWAEARRAWRHTGLDCPPGDCEVNLKLGAHPVRLNPRGRAEVVWCEALDPARAKIANVPTPESGFRFGDVVLRDGVPNGFRVWQGVEVPVFDVVALWQTSGLGTFEVVLDSAAPEAIGRLRDACAAHGWGFEESNLIRQLCETDDKGTISATSPPIPTDQVRLLVAAPSERALCETLATFQASPIQWSGMKLTCQLAPLG